MLGMHEQDAMLTLLSYGWVWDVLVGFMFSLPKVFWAVLMVLAEV